MDGGKTTNIKVATVGQLRAAVLGWFCVYSSTTSAGAGLRSATSRELEEKEKALGGGGTSRNLAKGKHQEVESCNTSQASVTPLE